MTLWKTRNGSFNDKLLLILAGPVLEDMSLATLATMSSGPFPAKKRLIDDSGFESRHPHILIGVDDYTMHPFVDGAIH
jgi:hypothetical protein